jgi:hypothetical protein
MLDSVPRSRSQRRARGVVGHGFRTDLLVLTSLGFDLKTSVVGILDTGDIARQVFGPPDSPHGLRLGRLFAKLRCPFDRLHIGGNDANLALRALLLLAVEGYRGYKESLDDAAQDRLEMIQAIGRSSLSCLSPPLTIAFTEE